MFSSFLAITLVFLLELRSALTVPTVLSESQIALVHDPQLVPQDVVKTVGIAFDAPSLDATEYVEIPMGKRVSIRNFPDLPKHPSRGKTVGVYLTQTGSAGTYRQALDAMQENPLCMAFLKPQSEYEDRLVWRRGIDHAERTPSGKALLKQSRDKAPAAPVWWRAADGWVDFESAKGRWWLKGLEVEALECM